MSKRVLLTLAAAALLAACSADEPSGIDQQRNNEDDVPARDTVGAGAGARGTIAGNVVIDDSVPQVVDATVWLYTGDPTQPAATWTLVDTVHTGMWMGSFFPGYFRFDTIPVGTYFVRAEREGDPIHAPGLAVNIRVPANDMVSPFVLLPLVSARGTPFLRTAFRGNRNLGVCGTLFAHAALGNDDGEPVALPNVTWTSSNASVVIVPDTSYQYWMNSVHVTGISAGTATITATSGAQSDTLTVQVFGNGTCPTPGSVASVEVSPDSASVAVGDTVAFTALPRDSAGTLVPNQSVTWVTSDSAVFLIEGAGTHVYVRGRGPGTAILRATVDGKTDQARVTVH